MRKWLAIRFYHHSWLWNWFPKVSYGHDQERITYTIGLTWLYWGWFVSLHCVYLENGKVDMKKGYTSSFAGKLSKKGWI